jgi:hypothetical protein
MSMGLSKQLGLLGFSGSDHPTSAERRSSDSRGMSRTGSALRISSGAKAS